MGIRHGVESQSVFEGIFAGILTIPLTLLAILFGIVVLMFMLFVALLIFAVGASAALRDIAMLTELATAIVQVIKRGFERDRIKRKKT